MTDSAPPGAGLAAQLARLEPALPSFLATRRWFGNKGQPIERVRVTDHAVLDEPIGAVLAIAEVSFAPLESGGAESSAATQVYFLPLVVQPNAEAPTTTQPNHGAASDAAPPGADLIAAVAGAAVYDGVTVPNFCRALLRIMLDGATLTTMHDGQVRFATVGGAGTSNAEPASSNAAPPDLALPAPAEHDPATMPIKVVGAEQSNTSIIFGDALIMKAIRRLQGGKNPELEILRFLAERTDFDGVPRLAGWGEYVPDGGEPRLVAILQAFVPNNGDGWSWALGALGELLATAPERADDAAVTSHAEESLARIGQLGRATARLHLALATGAGVADFAPEPIDQSDIERWRAGGLASLARGLARLRDLLGSLSSDRSSSRVVTLGQVVLANESVLRDAIEGLEILTSGTVVKTRHHGDYHLGQVLETDDDWIILDFEGEPLRPLAERRALHTPLRDVAGLLRSLDYARHAALRARRVLDTRDDAHAVTTAATWARLARESFLGAYLAEARAGQARFLPATDAALAKSLAALEGEKALYELEYELGNRPDWVEIPLAALANYAPRSSH